MYKNKAKNAQEAHECIRPTDMSKAPGELKLSEDDQRKLYELIWKRTIASQMEAARMERTTVTVASRDGEVELRATGQVILFDGFLKVYEEGRDDVASGSGDDEDSRRLPTGGLGRCAHACGRRAQARSREAGRGRWQGHPVGQWRRSGPAAFHPASPALHRGHAGQADGGTGHWAALHLRLDHRHDPGPRLCPEGQGPAVPRGQGTAGDGLPRQLLPPLSRIRLHRQSRGRAGRRVGRRKALQGRA